ncbi:hypothetical protein CDN99_15050 [Roseateles aquatilis]|uniref:Uncharacterized protein n=1 Tax=Roseateles aquatilis TaxID=431061 RepID=A0A246J8B0_9BURK|nr:hypothetical protein CDN99_15050 [Roseateles aquatilis]
MNRYLPFQFRGRLDQTVLEERSTLGSMSAGQDLARAVSGQIKGGQLAHQPFRRFEMGGEFMHAPFEHQAIRRASGLATYNGGPRRGGVLD